MTPILQAIPPRVRLHPALFDRLAFAVVAEEAGQPEAVQWALDRLADDFGPVRTRLADLTRQRREERHRARILAPLDESPTENELKRLARAEKELAEAKRKRRPIAPAASRRLAALDAIDTRRDMQWMNRRVDELDALESLRGGSVVVEEVVIDVPVLDETGAQVWRRGRKLTKRERAVRPRVLGRDGLEILASTETDDKGRVTRWPDLNPIQYVAGLRYRDAYEASDPYRSLGAVDPSACNGGRISTDPFSTRAVSSAHARAAAGRKVKELEDAVHDHVGEIGVHVLREIAGKGATMRSLTAGRRVEVFRQALQIALDVVADRLALQ